MDEPSESFWATNMVEGDVGFCPGGGSSIGLVEGAVGPMLVVVADGGREDSFEVPSVHDQDPVDELAVYGADPPFDERVRAGRA